jgi:regulator of RNase E activity RraA
MHIGSLKRAPKRLLDAFARVNTGTVSNALDKLKLTGVMRELKPVTPGTRMVGSAVTVWETAGELGSAAPEEMDLGSMIEALEIGDVCVIDNGGRKISSGGGVVAVAVKSRGAAGLVVDGSVRDVEQIQECGLPVFARHVVPVTGKGRIRLLSINIPVTLDGILIEPGDIIIGDMNGTVRVPIERAEEVLEVALRQDASDAETISLMHQGLSFREAQKRAGVK